jgi:hypothetical protein
MNPKSTFLACLALAGAICAPVHAQEQSAREQLALAHAQYYTPTASGLKSFHCEAAIDWKAMFARITGKEIPDDNPLLTYLNGIHLSVSDDLRGQGTLEWTSGDPAPAGKEAAVKQMREGFQGMVGGFFQSWNAYMNGTMVPVPDSKTTITQSAEGVHLSAMANEMKIDEDFDKNFLLTQARVDSPSMRVVALPSYTSTSDGLVVASVKSQVRQPPTAPETDVNFQIEYAKVDGYQVPSHIAFDIKNVGMMDIRLSGCQVSLAQWARKQ